MDTIGLARNSAVLVCINENAFLNSASCPRSLLIRAMHSDHRVSIECQHVAPPPPPPREGRRSSIPLVDGQTRRDARRETRNETTRRRSRETRNETRRGSVTDGLELILPNFAEGLATEPSRLQRSYKLFMQWQGRNRVNPSSSLETSS